MAHVLVVGYRPYLTRITRQNWPAVLIFPALLALGVGVLAWSAGDFVAFCRAVARGDARLAWYPPDVRGWAIAVPLVLVGLAPLAPIAASRDERRRAPVRRWIGGVAAAAWLAAFVFGPLIAGSIVQAVIARRGYRECPAPDARSKTLRWVRSDDGRAAAQCPTRWQDEWS